MRRDEAPEELRSIGLARSIRTAFSVYVDEVVLFLVLNVALVIAVAALGGLVAALPVALLLSPLLALPTAVLCRLAVAAARGGTPRWPMVGEELFRRPGRKIALAATQLVLLALALLNLSLATEIGGVLGFLSLVVSGYAVIGSSVFALALWPVVCDPRREAPLVQQLRLALAVVLLRPVQLAVLGLITVLAMVASVQLIAPALFLPSLIVLAIADYVVNVADRLRGVEP